MIGIHGTGATTHSGGYVDPQQYLDDFTNDVQKVANGQVVSVSDLDGTLKNLTANLSNPQHPLQISHALRLDLIDYEQNGTSGSNMISQMMKELESGTGVPSYKASGLSMAVVSEIHGDNSNVTAQLLRDLSNVTSGKKVVGSAQLEKLFYALGALNPKSLPKSFSADLQDFFQNGTNGTGAISQLVKSLQSSTVPTVQDGGIAMALQAQYTGNSSSITESLLNDLSALSKNPKALNSTDIKKLEQMFYALGELNPDTLPKNFQTDLSDFMQYGTSGTGMIAGLMKALQSGSTTDVSSFASVVKGECQGQTSELSQLLSDLQKLSSDPSSVPMATMENLLKIVGQVDMAGLPPGLQKDLQDYEANGTKGTGNIAKMMNAMQSGNNSNVSAYAIVVNMEAGGTTNITSAIQKDLTNLMSDPTSVSVTALTSLLKAASILQVKGFQPAFASDISDFEKNGTAGKGFIAQLVKAMQGGNPSQIQGLAGVVNIEEQTGKSPLDVLNADLTSLSTNPNSVTAENFSMALNAVAFLDPSGMSPQLQKDLEEYKNQDPHSLFSQLSSALKNKQVADVMPLAMALSYESKGGSQALLSQIEKDLQSIQDNPKSVSATAFSNEMKALSYLNPYGLSSSFSKDLQDFNTSGTKGTGVIAQMVAAMQSGKTTDVPYMAAAITAEDKGDAALLKQVSSLIAGVETNPEGANVQQLTTALKTLAYLNPQNISSFFKNDLQDFLKNGTSGTGNIAKMFKGLSVNYGEASNCAKEVQQEMESSPAQLMASLQSDFQSLAKDPNSVALEDIQNLLSMIVADGVSGYPPGMQQELQNYSKGTGLLANLLSQMKETPKPAIITTTAMILNDVSMGKVSDIEGAFQSDVSKLQKTPGSVSFREMDELVRGLAESNPTGLPADFQAGLQDYVKNGTSGSSLIAQFMKSVQSPSQSGDGALRCVALAQAAGIQLSGQSSSLVSTLKGDISQLISSGKGPSADDLTTLLYTMGDLKMGPPQISANFQTDLNDFMQNGTSGSGYLAQLVSEMNSQSPSTTDIEYIAMGVHQELQNTSFAETLSSDLVDLGKDPESHTFNEMDKLFRAINFLNPESIANVVSPGNKYPITNLISRYCKNGPDIGADGSYVQNLMSCLSDLDKNPSIDAARAGAVMAMSLNLEVQMKGGDWSSEKSQFVTLLTNLKNNPRSFNAYKNQYIGFGYLFSILSRDDANPSSWQHYLKPPLSDAFGYDANTFFQNLDENNKIVYPTTAMGKLYNALQTPGTSSSTITQYFNQIMKELNG